MTAAQGPLVDPTLDKVPTEDEHTPTKTVFALTLGAKAMLLVGALLLLLAAYLFWSPLGQSVPNSFPAKCGSAAKPPTDNLGKAVCGNVNAARRAQAITALVAAVVVAGGGLLVFGVRRETGSAEATG